MKRSIYIGVYFLMIIPISCNNQDEEFNVQEHIDLLTSHNWISEYFIYDNVSYDQIELLADVTDTVNFLVPELIPGDKMRSIIWSELTFRTNSTFIGNKRSTSYLKCKNCNDFIRYYNNSEIIFRKYIVTRDFIESMERIGGKWIPSENYKIDYLSNSRIKIYHWIKIPLSDSSTFLNVSLINGTKPQKKDYYFDVIFRQD